MSLPFTAFRQLLPALGVMISGCVVVPVTTTAYDYECRVVTKRMELEAVQIATLGSCRNSECGAALAAFGVTAVGSTVISGSIAIVGNVVYWLERQGQCLKPDSPTSQRVEQQKAAAAQ